MEASRGDGEQHADIAHALRAIGISEEIITRAVDRGDPVGAVFEQVLSPQKAERTVSAAQIEADGGLSTAQSGTLMAAFGLRVPDDSEPAYTEKEAASLVALGQMQDIYPPALALQVARVYGRLLARIAQTEVQLFRAFVEPRLRAQHGDAWTAVGAIQDAFSSLLPVTDPMLVGVHRRWVEHQVTQAAVREAESGWADPLPGGVGVAFLFCDLKDFTRYVDLEGDEAGVEAIDKFAEVAVSERGDTFRFTKWLGDGVMLAYGQSEDAVEAGRRIMAAMPKEGMPSVHSSVHCGVAIAREGDYYGRAVNLAARVLGIAGPDELLATRAVVDRVGDRFAWERAGAVRVRGIAGLVELFRLA